MAKKLPKKLPKEMPMDEAAMRRCLKQGKSMQACRKMMQQGD